MNTSSFKATALAAVALSDRHDIAGRYGRRRNLAAIAQLVVLFALAVPGCTWSRDEYDPATQYTPESLAKELVFRYKALSPSARTATYARRRVPAAEKPDTKAAADATKKAPAQTPDELVEETAAKLLLIRSMPRSDALKKVLEAIVQESGLTIKDKTLLTDRLESTVNSH